MGVFMIVFLISRYVSLGSISAAVAFPLTLVVRENVFKSDVEGYGTLIFFSIGIAILLIFTHRTNIKRLIEGRENKLTNLHLFRKKSKTS
jgi:glycerol-3-phosphate acyltransferase PlsY